ncbi:hypothetical protein ACVWV0_000586 [Ewingella americana]
MIQPVGGVSLRAAIRGALRTGGMMALVGFAYPALAEPGSACFADLNAANGAHQAELALPATQNLCIRSVHEGRAAVQLPAAQIPAAQPSIDQQTPAEAPVQPAQPSTQPTQPASQAAQATDQPAAAETQPAASPSPAAPTGNRWGFLDAQGQLVIKPVFDNVGDFHFGAAKAEQAGKWGYIDATGNWIIKPTFDQAENFTQSGLAVVALNGKVQIIDRKGSQVGQPLDQLVDTATLSDGEPARLRLDYKTVLLAPDESRHVASDKMEILQPFGKNQLFIARGIDGYGIADQNLEWRLKPQFKNIQLDANNQHLALATGNDGITLIRDDGTPDTQKYLSVKAVTPTFWLAKATDGIKLLDNSSAVVASFDEEKANSLIYQGNYVLSAQGKESVEVYVPGKKAALNLPAGSVPLIQDTGNFLLTVKDGSPKVNAIISASGGMIGGAQNVAWLSQIADNDVINGNLWLKNEQGKVINIVDSSGKALISQKNNSALEGYRLEPLRGNAASATAPIALIRPDSPSKTGAGFMRADGSLQIDSKWLDIQPAAAEVTADPKGDISQQFIVKTAQGTGIVDEQGKVRVPLTEDNISPFEQGYALDYLNGKLTAIDTSGKHFTLPDAFELESIGNGWFRFRETASEGALWGIYDVLTQKVISSPAYKSVDTYAGQQAAVQLPNGLWGLADESGKLVVDATYAKAERINPALWLLTDPLVADQPETSVLASVMGTDIKQRIAPTTGLDVTQFKDGRILATAAGGQSWLLSSQGNIELHEQQTQITAVGDWIKLSRQPQEGYLSAQGNWQIEPALATESSAFVKDRALRSSEQGTELIDNTGARVALMPAGQWHWPLASDMPVSYDAQDDVATTRYVDGTGKLALTVQGKASVISNGRAVLTRDDGQKVWIDAQGKVLPDVNYADLGLPVNDLAFAKVENHYGFINAAGKFVIPPVFDAVSTFDSGVAIASTGDTSMMLDTSGKPLARVDIECGIPVLYGAGSTRQWPVELPNTCTAPAAESKK